MKNKGFTLIELLMVFAMIAILAAVIFPAVTGLKPVDYVCRSGYKFTHTKETQIIGANGGGIPCDDVKIAPTTSSGAR